MPFNDTTHAFYKHPSVLKLHEQLKLEHYAGYVSLINPYKDTAFSSSTLDFADWVLFDVRFGIPLFDRELNKRILALFKERKQGRLSNLRRMLEANRALALRLVDFIQTYQTISVLDEQQPQQPQQQQQPSASTNGADGEYLIRRHAASLNPTKKNAVASGMVIFPTQCVLFMDGRTSVYANESH